MLAVMILYVKRVEDASIEYLEAPASNGLYFLTDD